MPRTPLQIGGFQVSPGQRKLIELPIARLYTDTDLTLPVHVIRGKRNGPTLFVSAAIHGDELNGIEIIRRLLKSRFSGLRGTLIAVPVVNVYGVLSQSRYLPDRRDLNRSFPGSPKGSLAARLAHLFMTEIVSKCDYGIDLHTGALHRSNLPQIRADLSDAETRELSQLFGTPVVLHSDLRDGSLREAAGNCKVKLILYEAGEALRFDEVCIKAGVRGILNVMRHLGMLAPSKKKPRAQIEPMVARSSGWVRATASGVVLHHKQLGDKVEKGEVIAEITSPYISDVTEICANRAGIIIGKQQIPLVQEGEAMYHIAYFKELDTAAEQIEAFHNDLLPE